MFELIRRYKTITGPARIIAVKYSLPLTSDISVHLPPGQVATLSSWYTQRQEFNYPNATEYHSTRFVSSYPAPSLSYHYDSPRMINLRAKTSTDLLSLLSCYRFVTLDPDIGSTAWITWGLKGPHVCPGRWFPQEATCIFMRAPLEEYEFVQERIIETDDEEYEYHAGVVTRREVGGEVSRRG